MLILALDTSGKTASCALARDGELLAEKKLRLELSYSRTLMPLCEELLAENKVTLRDIDLFAATVGPGSFTGIRIGVASVKGFAFAEGRPCVGVTSMLSAASAANVRDGAICAAVRAREDEYYTAFFRACGGELTQIGENAVLSGAETARFSQEAFAGEKVYLCGEGAQELMKLYPFLDTGEMQSAGGTARAAFKAEPVSCHELTPLYMKQSQAERNKEKIQ